MKEQLELFIEHLHTTLLNNDPDKEPDSWEDGWEYGYKDSILYVIMELEKIVNRTN